jgi:hypothetical protein
MRAIEPPTQVKMTVNTVREKALEIARLPTVRAMRAVFCDVLLARLMPLPSTLFSRIDYGSSKPPQTPF